MTTERPIVSPGYLASVQPIVLVGGKSRRFGRDKLREPWGSDGRVLVQYPIEALWGVFGRRVKLVGACDPTVEQLADGVIPDLHPGLGPIGGIVSALAQWPGSVFVLAGDMPSFAGMEITSILRIAQMHPSAHVVCAFTDRLQPCAAVYSQHARPLLEASVSRGDYKLLSALDPIEALPVSVAPEAAKNVNVPVGVHQVVVQPGRLRS
jgi:molybdopterin-guanine dinucleotide biosynthesis protein A